MKITKMVFKGVVTLCLFLFSLSCLAQTTYKSLTVGDKIPNKVFINLINYPVKTAKLSDFKRKLVILDFWNINCKGCIASWPKLLEIQKKFNDKIQIILVNPWNDEKLVKSLFEKRKKAGVNVTLPTVCKDLTWLKLFHISGVPYIVWVDSSRSIVSATGSASVNKINIQNYLDGKPLCMSQIISNHQIEFPKLNEPLFINDNGGVPEKTIGYSFFGKVKKNMYPGKEVAFDRFIKKEQYYAYCINRSVYEMYQLAFGDDSPGTTAGLQHSRIFLEVRSPDNYLGRNNQGEIIEDNLYAYQLVVTASTTRKQLRKWMQDDLQRYIGLNAKMEMRKIKCLVFTSTDTSLIQYKSGGIRQKVSDLMFEMNDRTMYEVIDNMYASSKYYTNLKYPILDETNFKGKLGGIEIEGNALNYELLDKGLQKYGMRLTLEEREVGVLVISEPPGYVFPYK